MQQDRAYWVNPFYSQCHCVGNLVLMFLLKGQSYNIRQVSCIIHSKR
uniref:Uncharacterized protein n=1 Tax=Anguilla anguilla TaxID=7936 RepID=A0A0E9SMS5_ANGAN